MPTGIGIGISRFLSYYGGSSTPPVTPNALIQAWYDSLAVKPSEALLTDLNTLSAGMDADGDWSEMDFFALIAGMETDEQRLRPLITTSGDDIVNVDLGSGGIVLDVNGAKGNAIDLLNSKWNPTDDGIKYTLNSAVGAIYGNGLENITTTIKAQFSTGSTVDDFNYEFLEMLVRAFSATSIRASISKINNNSVPLSANKAKTSGVSDWPYFAAIKRTAFNAARNWINGASGSTNSNTTTGLPTVDVGIAGYRYIDAVSNPVTEEGGSLDYHRAVIFGSGSLLESRVGPRLNTFFVSRGLNPYV